MPPVLGPEWTCTWDLRTWRERLDRLVNLGASTLFIYLMGHALPYASKRFPEWVEARHPNVEVEFFQQVVDWCVDRGIYLVDVFSTTGHAKGYTSRHPELAICDREGHPQVQSGIMCHHKEGARGYCFGVIEECLARYRGFAGVILHPPEFARPCFCEACQQHFRAAHGKSLLSATNQEAKRFFMATNLRFQRSTLEALIRPQAPELRLLTFTIPWVFEKEFEQIAKEIDLDTVIVDWDYDQHEERIARLPARLRRQQQFGHKVWFMLTSGFAFSNERSASEQADLVLRQVEAALAVGVRDIIYFIGPAWWPTVEQTSYYLHKMRGPGRLGRGG
ncbi:MAG: beta-galactosidase [candidate division KSB1 bacterium]|jgi:hypothetical protein|nr:beta-galactosidase [candidate division KSB1 bacterium]